MNDSPLRTLDNILEGKGDYMWHFVHCCRLLEQASELIEEYNDTLARFNLPTDKPVVSVEEKQ